MVHPIPESVKKIWDHWNIRGAIMLSLLLQTILIVFAPFRKRTSKKIIIFLIWAGYLLADATATFAVGLISNSQGYSDSNPKLNSNPPSPIPSPGDENTDLLAFWAPFLLVHLGGPDTITAFALEDNELWVRHFLALIFQAVATGYVFIQTLPSNKVMIPTFLLFLAGIIKYMERTCSLYLASMDKFRDSILGKPNAGPNYAKLMKDYTEQEKAGNPTQIIMIPDREENRSNSNSEGESSKDQLQIVRKAYELFQKFKRLIVDHVFSFKEQKESRYYFNSLSAEYALRIIEAELNFLYEVLFTKVVVVQSNLGLIFRLISTGSVFAALCVFHFYVKKQTFNGFDVGVSYALLCGAIGLDIVAFHMAIFSDWSAAVLKIKTSDDALTGSCWTRFTKSLRDGEVKILKKLLTFKELKLSEHEAERGFKFTVLDTCMIFRKWSRRISCLDMVAYCLKKRRIKICNIEHQSWFCGIIEAVYKSITSLAKMVTRFILIRIVSSLDKKVFPFTRMNKLVKKLGNWKDKSIEWIGLDEFVDEVKYASKEPLTKEIWDFIFKELKAKSQLADDPDTAKRIYSARGDWVLLNNDSGKYRKLMPYVSDVSYDQSLLLWHVATELLYNKHEYEEDKNNSDSYWERQHSKILSDYMLYLLILRPSIMQAVAGIGKIRFKDTCAETSRLFEDEEDVKTKPNEERDACKLILDVETKVKPIAVKGDGSKSVLFDGSMLAKELESYKNEKWKIISKVWVELLSYAASHCRATAHAQQISKGGELISLVWLLMAHFGLGQQFQINEGHPTAKLIVGNKS